MSDKDVTVTVSSSSISVNPETVRLKKGMDQAKWNCDNTQVTSLSIEWKDGSYTVPCSRQGNGTWQCKSKKFDQTGTFPYKVTASVNGGTPIVLDPEVIVDP
jgi:hypothetical protein